MAQKHGVVITQHGKIVSYAVNRFRNDPGVILDDHVQSTHAEIVGLRKIRRPEGSVVYVARWSPRDVPALSRPCPRCLAAMERIGVKKVVFTES